MCHITSADSFSNALSPYGDIHSCVEEPLCQRYIYVPVRKQTVECFAFRLIRCICISSYNGELFHNVRVT